MGTMRAFGAVLVVVSVILLLGCVVYYFSDVGPVLVGAARSTTGAALGAGGGVLLVLGIIFLVMSPKPKAAPAPPAAAPVATPVEIKRTQMNWGSNAAATPSDELQEELDAIDQKIGQVKVQYGMGQLSNESYRNLMAEYETEKSAIERRILEQRRG